MAYTLLGSIRSPFARICRMFMMHHKIDFEFRVLNFVTDNEHAAVLEKTTPIKKVPVLLLEDGQKIFDSRVIVNYLIKTHDLHPLTIDDENRVSAIYSCLDTGVIQYVMKDDGFDMNGTGAFLSRNRVRIPNNLKYLTPWASQLNSQKPEDWNYASMSLYSFLYWGEIREVLKVKDYPEMASFMEKFKDAPGVKETGF